jgi:hypothetical protein
MMGIVVKDLEYVGEELVKVAASHGKSSASHAGTFMPRRTAGRAPIIVAHCDSAG